MISNIDIKKTKQIYISADIVYIRIYSAYFITKMKQGRCHCRKSSFYDFTKLPPHLQSRQARQGRCQNSIKMKIFAFIVSPVAALLFKHPPSIWQSLIVIGTFTSHNSSLGHRVWAQTMWFSRNFKSSILQTVPTPPSIWQSLIVIETSTCSHLVSEIPNHC